MSLEVDNNRSFNKLIWALDSSNVVGKTPCANWESCYLRKGNSRRREGVRGRQAPLCS